MSSRKKGGLGRGLAELLGEGSSGAAIRAPKDNDASSRQAAAAAAGDAATRVGVLELPISAIKPNPKQPRRDIEAAPLQELAGSIESVGLIQPVIVRRVGEGYELIAGERRWRAAQLAGFTVIPAIVREASDIESLELALVENVVREDLNAIDEAFALQVLREDLGVTQEALAAQVGKSRSAIANKIRLLELPGPVQALLVDGSLTEGHGRALLGLRARGDQLRLARKAARQGMSVRAVEKEVRRANETAEGHGSSAPAATTIFVSPDTLDALRDSVYGALAVMPRVRLGRSGGVVELPFKDEAALSALVERLARG
ncbi:MAG: ParB/RepB/Spo0J family partition protein [Thermoleophilia bacterium]